MSRDTVLRMQYASKLKAVFLLPHQSLKKEAIVVYGLLRAKDMLCAKREHLYKVAL